MKNIVLILTSVLLFTSCQNNKKMQAEKVDYQQQKVDAFLEHIRKHEYEAALAMIHGSVMMNGSVIVLDQDRTKEDIMSISALIDKNLLMPENTWKNKSDSGKGYVINPGQYVIERRFFIFVDQQKDPTAPYCIVIQFITDNNNFPTTIFSVYPYDTKEKYEKLSKY